MTTEVDRVEEVRQRELLREQERQAILAARDEERKNLLTGRVVAKREDYVGGTRWQIPRKQFQALYVAVGSFDEAVSLQPELAPWPPSLTDTPPPHTLYSWASRIDDLREEVDPKILSNMEKKIEAHFRADFRKTIAEASLTVRDLAKMARRGELDAKKQVQLLYAANAANYGMGNYGQYIKNTAPQGPAPVNINGGRFTINAGQQPPSRRIKAKKAKMIVAPILEGEFREVPVGSSDST